MNKNFDILLIWAVVANGLWYTIKFILKKKRIHHRMFLESLERFLTHEESLINKENNIQNRNIYKIILYSLYACLAMPLLFIVATLLE